MSPAAFALIGAVGALVVGLLCRRYLIRRRRAEAQFAAQSGPSPAERNAARARVIEGVKRLDALESQVAQFAEGSDPGFPPDGHDDRRRQAAELHAKLEAECRRYCLPLGLVRRRRTSLVPTVGLLQ